MSPLHRRNFLSTVIVNLFLWATCGLIIFFLDPNKYLNVVLFFIALTLALTLTFALLFANTRRGFLVSLAIVGVLILKILCFRS